MKLLSRLYFFAIIGLTATSLAIAPVAIFHGLNDDCTRRTDVEQVLSESLDTHAECIEVGNGKKDSLFMNFEQQCQQACENLKAHPKFKDLKEINLIGFSQGGIIARYIVEACDWSGKVRNLVAVGAPNMGIINNDHCLTIALNKGDLSYRAIKTFSCLVYGTLNNWFVYSSWFDDISINSYFRIPEYYEEYLSFNAILPRLNNEVIHPDNERYRDRIRDLNSATFIQWDNDTVMFPRISQVFDQLTPPDAPFLHPTSDIHFHHRGYDDEEPLPRLPFSQDIQAILKYKSPYDDVVPQSYHPRYVIKMEASDWYEQDNLGLRSLNEANRLHFMHMPVDHYIWNEDQIRELYVPPLRL